MVFNNWYGGAMRNLVAFLALFFAGLLSQAGSLQPGDLVFLSMPCYICPLIEKTTGFPYSHVGIVVPESAGRWGLVMAVEPKVMEVDLQYLLGRLGPARPPLVMRMKTKEGQALAARAAVLSRSYLGIPYNHQFRIDNQSLYCSELVYFAFFRANNNQEVFPLTKMTFKPYTEIWRRALGTAPPEGLPGITPADIAHSPHLTPLAVWR